MHLSALSHGRVFAPVFAAGSILIATSTMLAYPATAAALPVTMIQAEAPESTSDSVVDTAGVLTAEQVTALEQSISEFEANSSLRIEVKYVKYFDGKSEQQWAQSVVKQAGPDTAVLAVAVEDGLFSTAGGNNWQSSWLKPMKNAAQQALDVKDFAGAGQAFVAQARSLAAGGSAHSGSSSGSSGSGNGLLWLGLGGAAVVGAGGAAKIMSSKKKKRDTTAALEQGRALPAGEVNQLGNQPIEVLQTLADEELVSTDESIRKAKEELSIATAEFGAERTRNFNRAMNTSTSTLQRAFRWKQQLVQGQVSSAERRTLLLQIIGECRKADEALDQQAADFAAMRNLLLDADARLQSLTQQSVELRTRAENAGHILASLASKYEAQVLESINDNIPLAQASLDQADKLIAEGREQAQKPAGQQGGVVDAIRASEDALNQASKQLAAIETADQNLSLAKTQLPALIREVESELQEAAQLKMQGQSQGTRANWQAFDAAVQQSEQALDYAKTHQGDPLGAWTQLTEADAVLDEQLDALRLSNTDQARVLQVAQQQFAAADAAIQGAAGFIQTRGRVIGPEARAALAEAERSRAMAQQTLQQDARAAVEIARQARAHADEAQQLARQDVNRYQNRNNRGGGGGDFITGMVIGQLLGGGHGGFGGGFGGGGFSGGGSFGGGGGGFSGGGSF